MSKKKKEPAAQRLIDDLLDDNSKVPDLSAIIEKDESKSKSIVLELENFRKTELPPLPDVTKEVVKDLASELEKTLNAVMPKDSDELAPEDRTMKIPKAQAKESERARVDSRTATEIRLSSMSNTHSKHFSAPPIPGMPASNSIDATLRQSESLRIAQNRILDLENELEKIRRENEQLAAAGETLRRRADELLAKSENLDTTLRDKEKIYEEERKLLRAHLHGKDRDLNEQKQKLDELEQRLESNFKKIRVRERDLEHRLEIAKVEHASLLGTKDKMILELKRQVDQLTSEAEYSKAKSHEMYNQFKEKQETVRRVVRALRIALSILEGEDDTSAPLKKAE